MLNIIGGSVCFLMSVLLLFVAVWFGVQFAYKAGLWLGQKAASSVLNLLS